MARRVNTKFVVILSSALIGAVGIFVGWRLVRSMRNSNPDYMRGLAETAERSGDLKVAANDYAAAARLLSVKHRSGADELYAKSADLCMKISREAQTQADAVVYYQRGMENYNAALAENPLNKEVNQTLLEEDYQNAVFQPSVAAWKQVETVGGKLIVSHDGATPRLYRAEARLRLLTGDDAPAAIADIKSDLQKALAFEPGSGKAVALQAQVMWYQARVAAQLRGLSKIEEFKADYRFQSEATAVRQMLICHLEHRAWPQPAGWTWLTHIPLEKVNSDAAAELADLSIDQYRISGGSDPGRLNAAAVLLNAALASDTSKDGLADELGQLYRAMGQADKSEALFKKLAQDAPENPQPYYRLARFYSDMGKLPEAIAAYKEVTRHTIIGNGREARRNLESQIIANNEIAWLDMELSERKETTPEQLKAYLKEAADATDKLRAANALKGLIDLLDGRRLLLKHDMPHALSTLRSAEANLSGGDNPWLKEKYRATELLLAKANEMENQPGAALDLYNKALEIGSDNFVLLQKARLLLQLGRFSEVQILTGKMLGETDPGKFTLDKNLPPAVADLAKQYWTLAGAKQHPDVKIISGDSLKKALLEMDAGDFDSALTDALAALDKPGNSDADTIMAYQVAINCSLQLKHNDEAKALAAKALAQFPQNANFQVAKAKLDQPGSAGTFEVQQAWISAITDPYIKAMNLAALDHRFQRWDDEIAILQAQRDILKGASAPDDRDRLNNVLDRLFSAMLAASGGAKTDADRAPFFKDAQGVVGDLEKLNLDGTDGKIYQGMLDLTTSNGKTGLQFLQQAVAQRPDYAHAHLMLAQAYRMLSSMDSNKSGSSANMSSALEELRTVIRLAPNNILALQQAIELLVRKGDSSSLKEAQTYLESGLAQAPHNSLLISYTEIFADKVDDSIAMREGLLKQQPDDRNNIRRLASLYVRKKDKEVDAEKKQQSMDRAIALMQDDFARHPEELGTGDMLAHLLVEYDKTDKGATKAIGIYDTFARSTDAMTKFGALIAKAEFFRTLLLRPEAIALLQQNKLIGKEDLREEAADILLEAGKVEPADRDDAERHLGDMYFDLGRFADAEKTYLKVLADHKTPDSMDRVNRRLIEAELRQAKYADAQPRLAELLGKLPTDVQGLILRAYASIQQGLKGTPAEQEKGLKAALADLNQVLAQDPGNADALFYRATAELTLGDRLDDAEKDLIEAGKRDKSAVNSRMLLAELYVRTQHYEEASRVYREILALHPELLAVRVEYTDLLRNLAELQATLPTESDVEFVLSLRRLGPADKLMDEIKAAEQIYPGQLRWPLLYGQALSIQGKDAEALRYYQFLYEQLQKQNTLDAGLCDAYLLGLLKTKDYAKVIDLATNLVTNYMDFITQNPQYVSFFLKRAAAYQAQGKQDLAIKDIDQAIATGVGAVKVSGNFGPLFAVLAEAASNRDSKNSAGGQLDAAVMADRLRERLKANPDETITQIGLIQMLLIMNQAAEAVPVAEALKAPADNATLHFLVYRELALVHGQNKQYAAAEKDYQELLKLAPDNVEVLNNYAFMLTQANRAKEAKAPAERALKLLSTRSDPNQLSASLANVYDTLGWADCLNGDLASAEANLRKSLSVQPQAATYLHLAQVLQKLGRTRIDEAVYNCKQGIQLATTRHDDETLASLKELQVKLADAGARP